MRTAICMRDSSRAATAAVQWRHLGMGRTLRFGPMFSLHLLWIALALLVCQPSSAGTYSPDSPPEKVWSMNASVFCAPGGPGLMTASSLGDLVGNYMSSVNGACVKANGDWYTSTYALGACNQPSISSNGTLPRASVTISGCRLLVHAVPGGECFKPEHPVCPVYDGDVGSIPPMSLYCAVKGEGTGAQIVQVGSDFTCRCDPDQVFVGEANHCRPIRDEIVNCEDCDARYGNPISPLTGAKRDVFDLGRWLGGVVQLSYDNQSVGPRNDPKAVFAGIPAASFGPLWESSLHRRLQFQKNRIAIQVSRGLGRWVSFTKTPANTYAPASSVQDRLVDIGGAWRYYDATALTVETFDDTGLLKSLMTTQGLTLTFTYSTSPTATAPEVGLLTKVTDQWGHTLQFAYEGGTGTSIGLRITTLTDPANQVIRFAYSDKGFLNKITWPDTTSQQFLYENAALPWALTGVIDETGTRRSTYTYDSQGRAIATEGAGGANRFQVSWGTAPSWRIEDTYDATAGVVVRKHFRVIPQNITLTTSYGQSTTLNASDVAGMPKLGGSSQPAGAGYAAANRQRLYDSRGNVTQDDDFNGVRSCFTYDATRRIETARYEGLDTSTSCDAFLSAGGVLPIGARKISTQWHPDWPLQTRVAEPGRITTYVYNGQPDPTNGNAGATCAATYAWLPDRKPIPVLCRIVEQATTDSTGQQGFSAAAQAGVPVRASSWTYDINGLMLTAVSPANATTAYTYYTDTTADHMPGDLQKVTNALNQVTTFTKYNRLGQLLESIDPNGAKTTNAYDSRQRLTSTTMAGQATTYVYWPSGLLKQVTQADGNFVAYEYDAAQRLKAVTDQQGSRIEYELDNAGQRIGESVKDANGNLRRSLARVMDAVGRLQQVTGRE